MFSHSKWEEAELVLLYLRLCILNFTNPQGEVQLLGLFKKVLPLPRYTLVSVRTCPSLIYF